MYSLLPGYGRFGWGGYGAGYPRGYLGAGIGYPYGGFYGYPCLGYGYGCGYGYGGYGYGYGGGLL
jgi:hypothetical protein